MTGGVLVRFAVSLLVGKVIGPVIIDSRWFTEWLDPLAPLPALLEVVHEPFCGPFERRAFTVSLGHGGHQFLPRFCADLRHLASFSNRNCEATMMLR